MKTILAITTIAVLSLTNFEVSQASANDAPKAKVVRLTDLDLTRLEGAASLYSRLLSAARAVCGSPLSQRAVSDRLSYEACIDDSVAAAAAEVDQDLVREYVARKGR